MKRCRSSIWAFFAPPIMVVVFFLLACFSAQAAVLFSLRGDSLTPRYAAGGKAYSTFLGGSTLSNPPAPVTCSDPSCFGGWAIASSTAGGDYREWYYLSRGNFPTNTRTMSIRVRFAPNYSGTPPNDINLIRIGEPRSNTVYGGVRIWVQDNNTALFQAQPKNGLSNLFLSAPSMSAIPLANGVFRDYMLVMNGATGMWYASIEGVEIASGSMGGDNSGPWNLDTIVAPNIVFGTWPFNGWINEATIWDTAEPHVYTARTAWLDVPDFDGTTYSDPGEANVLSSASYTYAGVAKTGTYNIADRFTDISEDDVLEGTSWAYNSLTNNRSGNYVAPDSTEVKDGISFGVADTGELYCEDPGVSFVAAGRTYYIYSDEFVGTREVVTNVMSNSRLRGQAVRGTLRAR